MHSPDLRELLREHGSPSDDAHVADLQSTLSFLKHLPDLEPSPDAWKKIESKLTPRRTASFSYWLRAAAAASILVAVLSFAVVMTAPRTGALPVVVETGKALKWNDRFTAEQFCTLALPDVGTLKLNRNSVLRFENPRRVILESGEVFAEIIPSGKGFEILSGDSTVRVRGTKFGVTAPATVYVVEGAVEVASPRGRMNLGPRQAAVGSRLVEIGADEYLRWLAQYERAAVRLSLDLCDQTIVSPGAPLKWKLLLETDAIAPLILGRPRDVSQFFSLIVDGAARPLDPSRVRVTDARTGADGLVRADRGHPCVFECAIDPGLFREKGPVSIRAVYTSGSPAADVVWEGIVRSPALTVEVR